MEAGVILYILLSGVPPFWAETEASIFEQILRGPLDFESSPWPCISDSAKDLIHNMLNRDPKKRFTAHEILCHPWIVDVGMAPDKPLDFAVLSRLKQFSAMNKLKKMALRVIAENLSEEEIGGLIFLFKMFDTDNSGAITYDELKFGLKRVGSELMESEIQALMNAADMDNSGTIDYGEFLAATLHTNKLEREENLINAFSFFDKDGSGYITINELSQACSDFGLGEVHLEDMIKEIDQNNDGQIDYSEFVAMMRKGTGGTDNLKMLLDQSEQSRLSNFRDKWSSLEVFYLDIKKATSGFNESSKIGSGGYGSVYKGKLGGTMVAIKMLDSKSKQGLKEFSQELEVLYQMRHPNLVKLIGACFEKCALVYEYLPNGSLEDCLEYSPNLLTWQMRTRIIYEICSALIYLHSRSVVHGDLKPANILLDANFKSKLADFGLCRVLPQNMTTDVFLETVPKGTSGYIDPWFLETSILRPGSDLYSFGITILKLLTQLSPVGLGRKAHDADENSFRKMIDATAGSWPFDLAKELLYWSLQCCYRNEKSSELLKDMSTCLEDMLAEIETLLGGRFKSLVAEGKKATEDPLEVAEVEEKNEEEKEEVKRRSLCFKF